MSRPVNLIFMLVVAALGCSSANPEAATEATPAPSLAPTPAPTPAPAKVTLVDDPSLVCMVNNQFMGTPQIPVEVEGTTYYGCCDMCKTKLANDPTSRTAIDPISGVSIDKARAVLGKTTSGAIYYFESEENLDAYAKN